MSEYHEETGEIAPSGPLQGLHGELLCSPDTAEVWGALIQAQAEMEPPLRSKTAKVKGRTREGREYEYEYKYAPLEEIIAKLRTPFAKHSLGYQQFLTRVGANPVLRTIIFHKSAQWTAVDYPIFWDTSKGGQQDFQKGVTYARRGGLSLATGVAPEDDDDANAADGQVATISEKPVAKGATRVARPTAAAENDKFYQKFYTPPAISTEGSPGPSPTSNGNGVRPKWVTDFFARDTYEINRNKLGSWSEWESFYLRVADLADNLDQLLKLDDDNKVHCKEFAKAHVEAVYNNFRARINANAKRLSAEPWASSDLRGASDFVERGDIDTLLQGTSRIPTDKGQGEPA